MKAKIIVGIESLKTWKEINGGPFKTIMEFYMEEMKKAIEDYCDGEMDYQLCIQEPESDCEKCSYNIANDIDDYKKVTKAEFPVYEECAFCMSEISEHQFIENKKNKTCQYFTVSKVFKENLSYEEEKELIEELKQRFSGTTHVVRDFGKYKIIRYFANNIAEEGEHPCYGDIFESIGQVRTQYPTAEILRGFGVQDTTGYSPDDAADWYDDIESAEKYIKDRL